MKEKEMESRPKKIKDGKTEIQQVISNSNKNKLKK